MAGELRLVLASGAFVLFYISVGGPLGMMRRDGGQDILLTPHVRRLDEPRTRAWRSPVTDSATSARPMPRRWRWPGGRSGASVAHGRPQLPAAAGGRAWVSTPGNLYASLLLLDPAPLCASRHTAARRRAAFTDARARAFRALAVRWQIKWPNDILVDGAKICGILIESMKLDAGPSSSDRRQLRASSRRDALYPTTDLRRWA